MGLLNCLWNCVCVRRRSASAVNTHVLQRNTWIKRSDVNLSDVLTKCQMARRTVAPTLLSAPQLYAIDLSTVYPSFLTARAESFQLQSFISARRGPVRPCIHPSVHPSVPLHILMFAGKTLRLMGNQRSFCRDPNPLMRSKSSHTHQR